MLGEKLSAEEHPIACEVRREPQHRPPRRSRAIDEQERRRTELLLWGPVADNERLALNGLGSVLEPGDENRQQVRVRCRVRVDDDHGVRGLVSRQQLLERPSQRAALAARIRLVADEHLGACPGGDACCVIGAVVCDDNDPVPISRVRLILERVHTVPDRPLLVMGRDEHDDVGVAVGGAHSLPVEERDYGRNEEIERRCGQHSAQDYEENIEAVHR